MPKLSEDYTIDITSCMHACAQRGRMIALSVSIYYYLFVCLFVCLWNILSEVDQHMSSYVPEMEKLLVTGCVTF